MPSLDTPTRKLAAIMFTDIVGFTKIMGEDESKALNMLEKQQIVLSPVIEESGGKILKKMGDGMLIEFPSTVNAVEGAIKMQDSLKEYNSDTEEKFYIRIGIHLGDVITIGDDILGDGVNVASRIEPLADPGGICLTEAVFQTVKSKLKLDVRMVEDVELKNIIDRYTVYKFPKTNLDSDKKTVDDSSEEQSPRIKITSFQTLSNTSVEILKASPYGLVMWLVVHPIANIILKCKLMFSKDMPFFQDFKILPTSLRNDEWSLFFTTYGEGVIDSLKFLGILFIVMTLCFFKKKIKVTFADIRNVDKLLDYMVTELGSVNRYQILERKGNAITYYPYTRGLKWMEKPFLLIFKKFESLTLDFDGNVVKINGVWWSVRRLMKQLKAFELY